MAITLDGSNGISSPDFEPSSSTVPTNGLFLPTTNTIAWATNSTERLRLDASGNLGLGVTPSAWSTGKSFEIGNSGDGVSINYGFGLNLNRNTYYNGGFKYGSSDYASRYAQTAGQHQWFIAPSGTAGAAISFTQAMTLSAAGGLSVGTTSDAGAGNIWAVNSIYAGDGSVSNNSFARAAGTGTGIYFPAANTIGFTTNAIERARIDSSGNLLVGKTAPDNSERLGVRSSGSTSSTYGVRVDNSAGTASFLIRDDGYLRCPTTYSLTGGTANLSIDASGFITRSTSSIRYKRDVEDYTKSVNAVSLLRPVFYKSSVPDANNEVPETQFAGLIAEELHEAGFSEFVEYNLEGQPDAIRYGNMVALCIKAIQELTQRLEKLENQNG